MKSAILCLLVATVSAASSCQADKDTPAVVANCVCVEAGCLTCIGTDSTDAAAKTQSTGKCLTCQASGFTKTDGSSFATDSIVTCPAVATGDGETDGETKTEGGAAKGEACDPVGEGTGCAEGLQCGTTVEVKASGEGDTAIAAVGGSVLCSDATLCATELVTCGAMQLGASIVAAIAVANLM